MILTIQFLYLSNHCSLYEVYNKATIKVIVCKLKDNTFNGYCFYQKSTKSPSVSQIAIICGV
jgi:hypothetical protein